MKNERPGVLLRVAHTLRLPACCPVTGNPQAGSTLRITYQAGETVLDVMTLPGYLREYVGGHLDGTRNMETMLQKTADDLARALGVPVHVTARLHIKPPQILTIRCIACP